VQQRRRRAGLAVGLALTVSVCLLTGGTAVADDVTDDDVAQAQAAVADAASRVAQIEVRLAEQSAALDAAWVAVEVAAEDYATAMVVSEAADQAAEDAARRATDAENDRVAARDELGRIAMEANRSGGGLDGLVALLASDGYDDFVARSTAIDQVGQRADRVVQEYEAAETVSRTLAAGAEDAAAAAAQAADEAQAALDEAERLQADAEQKVAEVAAEREALIGELAELRATSLEIERERQAQVEAERQARADAAAQAGHPTTPATGGSGGSGGSTGGSPPTTPPAPPPASDPTPTTPPASGDPNGLGTGSQRGSAEQGQAAVAWAVAQVGKTYVYGATGPDSFDCSGLIMRAWQAAGVNINRTSRDQYRGVLKITYDSMRPGDLIFWGSNPADPGSIHHVAMYIGDGQMVEASRPGVPLRVTAIRWSGTMSYAGRP